MDDGGEVLVMNPEGGPFYRFLRAICRVIERTNTVLIFMGCCIIAIIAIVTMVDTIGRYISRPVHGIHELSELLVIFSAFLAFGAVQYTRSHINVEVVFQHLSEGWQRFTDTLTLLLCFLFCLGATWGTTRQMIISIGKMEHGAGYARFPLYPSKTVLAIGMAYLTLIVFIQLVGRISEYFGVPSIQRQEESTVVTNHPDDKTAI